MQKCIQNVEEMRMSRGLRTQDATQCAMDVAMWSTNWDDTRAARRSSKELVRRCDKRMTRHITTHSGRRMAQRMDYPDARRMDRSGSPRGERRNGRPDQYGIGLHTAMNGQIRKQKPVIALVRMDGTKRYVPDGPTGMKSTMAKHRTWCSETNDKKGMSRDSGMRSNMKRCQGDAMRIAMRGKRRMAMYDHSPWQHQRARPLS